jgi:hypothetical protein
MLQLMFVENAHAVGICFNSVNHRDHVSPLLRQFAARGAKSYGERWPACSPRPVRAC